jgi:hypothetical protein
VELRDPIRPAIPSLIGLLQDWSSDVRSIVTSALANLVELGKSCLKIIVTNLMQM